MAGLATRPTSDRLRETLFNILGPRVESAIFLDAYAGTGAVGIEALSRGASRAIFIEKSKAALKLIQQNVASLKIEDRTLLVAGPVLANLPRHQANIVFLDPPYDLEREYGLALNLLARQSAPLVIAQHSVRFRLEDRYGTLGRTRVVKQGDNALSFFYTS